MSSIDQPQVNSWPPVRTPKWRSLSDLMSEIHDAQQRVRLGQTDAVSAHAEARFLGTAVKLVEIAIQAGRRLDHDESAVNAIPDLQIFLPLHEAVVDSDRG